jgi:hypothetical protein
MNNKQNLFSSITGFSSEYKYLSARDDFYHIFTIEELEEVYKEIQKFHNKNNTDNDRIFTYLSLDK